MVRHLPRHRGNWMDEMDELGHVRRASFVRVPLHHSIQLANLVEPQNFVDEFWLNMLHVNERVELAHILSE